jgi:hypothetical protein
VAAKKGKHAKKGKEAPEEPLPGTAAMGQGQPAADIEPPDADMPEQPDKLVTGQEALAEQQQDPRLDDRGTARGT